jgi:hypothetical protein
MIRVPIINQRLKQILDNFKDEILNNDESVFQFEKNKSSELDRHNSCSLEYLEKIRNNLSVGKAYDAWCSGLNSGVLADNVKKLNVDLSEWDNQNYYFVPRPGFVSIRQQMFETNALATIYPANGFMSWHNNSDASGHNVLFTWSENGNGFFRYEDPITKEIVTLDDSPGWTCKVGYFGKMGEQDKLFWHCCSTEEIRITVAWIFPTLQAADKFKDQIQQL